MENETLYDLLTDKETKRYMVTGTIVIVSLLVTLGILLYQARHVLRQTDSAVVPSVSHGVDAVETPPAPAQDQK